MESSSEVVNFGKSLLVPSVLELAKEPIDKIPIRYVHHDQDPPSNDIHVPSVPIVNLKSLLTGESMNYELEKLHFACIDWGFFSDHRPWSFSFVARGV